ncbi:related to glomerulosclerosis protein Mpv17 [Cephalotrichum gorgonifer]|uniref:Related to glomerulosclerosis protein Mpv17 n=1 Tax=Cephalotrichum gorgonifer TaxID=2041049 RepID=A0AAE8MYM9_9PEZI|nr:related to glomerulosclerosis protein Mpv17 [Cephalotrichum gorgonifer]
MVLRWYRGVLASRPILTQSVTTGLLMATGDIIAQQGFEKKGRNHDAVRTARMTGYGAFIFGPAAANWYRFLNRYVVLGNKNTEIAARVVLDQGLFSPAAVGVFLGTMGVLEGRQDPGAHVQEHYWQVLKANWMVWPAFQVVNFKFIPTEHRLSFANVVAIGWNCYLSYANSHKKDEVKEGVKELVRKEAEMVKKHLK